MIARELRGWIEGKGIQGVKVIPEVNREAVEIRERASPIDEEDLNRAFPGNPNGTASQLLAHNIFQEAKDYECVIDLHTYGTGGRCVPYMLTDLEKDFNVELCMRVGLDNAVQTGGTSQQLFLELSNRRVPSMIIEAGGAQWLRQELDTVEKVLKGFLEGRSPDGVRFFNSYQWFSVEESGRYRPVVPPGTKVQEGEVLGYLEDEPITSPVHGFVLGVKMEGFYDAEKDSIASIAEF